MSYQRIIGVALLVVGIVLLVCGIDASHKFHEKVVDEFTGGYTNTTMGYIVGGLLLTIIGGGMAMARKRF
jgi:hypothetical protein